MAFVRYLRQSTQATVTIGPVWATDNVALKSDLAYNASGINCDVYKNGTKADVSLSGSAGNGYFVPVQARLSTAHAVHWQYRYHRRAQTHPVRHWLLHAVARFRGAQRRRVRCDVRQLRAC